MINSQNIIDILNKNNGLITVILAIISLLGIVIKFLLEPIKEKNKLKLETYFKFLKDFDKNFQFYIEINHILFTDINIEKEIKQNDLEHYVYQIKHLNDILSELNYQKMKKYNSELTLFCNQCIKIFNLINEKIEYTQKANKILQAQRSKSKYMKEWAEQNLIDENIYRIQIINNSVYRFNIQKIIDEKKVEIQDFTKILNKISNILEKELK